MAGPRSMPRPPSTSILTSEGSRQENLSVGVGIPMPQTAPPWLAGAHERTKLGHGNKNIAEVSDSNPLKTQTPPELNLTGFYMVLTFFMARRYSNAIMDVVLHKDIEVSLLLSLFRS